MSEIQSPLVRLMLFMVCLSIAGAFLAGVHYFVVDQPQQGVLSAQIPDNGNGVSMEEKCTTCKDNCKYTSACYKCMMNCELSCDTITNEEAKTYCG